MRTWKCSERLLASFHVERHFYFELLREMRPWMERAQHVRRCVYMNATDGKRKDQEHWMRMYEKMIVEQVGERARFLPPDPKAKEVPGGTAGGSGQGSGPDAGIEYVVVSEAP